jgi:signal transduction histidine kinase
MVFVAAPLGWSYLRQSLFDLQVLDRQAVIENMEDAVFVFDTEDVLRRVNDHGRRLLEADEPLEGQSASTLFAAKQVLLDAYLPVANSPPATGSARRFDRQHEQSTQPAGIAISDGDGTNESAEITVEGDSRWYDIRASPIRNSADEQTGTVLVARDVTAERRRRKMLTERTEELKRKTKTLERQNERLDQFAAVVSHDLRNPLNVAQLRLGLLREDAPEEHAEVVERNLDRMESMIEELLTMARAQTTVEETETVYLASLAEDAWETVPAERATLDIQLDRERTVEGDRELLLNVFENLFRNAVEHGSTSPDSQARQDSVEHGVSSDDQNEATGAQLTVRVGRLPEGAAGFYVEDTGKGITELNTEELFEFGQTTSEEGTGLGLAIVRELVRAHGWEISATNASHGGARFEIRTEVAADGTLRTDATG